jgi:hypothetical protein
MKRIAIAAILTAVLVGPALAGQCPVDMKKIDAALGASPQISAAQMTEVTKLRAEGAKQHKGGQHGASVKTLAKAKEILGIM